MSRLRTTTAPASVCEDPEGDREPSDLAGLYLLDHRGTLAWLDICGTPVPDPRLTKALTAGIDTVLERYRGRAMDAPYLGLITDGESKTGAQCPCMLVFSDAVLNSLFDAGRRPETPPTSYEKHNKSKNIVQGMELLLNKKRGDGSLFPYFCPVLFVPEVERGELGERYGLEVFGEAVYEVLDLAAPYLYNRRPPREIFDMRATMRRSHAGYVPGNRMDAVRRRRGEEPMSGSEDRTRALVQPQVFAKTPPSMRIVDDTFFGEGDAVTGWLLEWFSPFNELTETQREIIAGYEAIRKVPAGTRLIERGSMDDACVYLIEGTLNLETEDGGEIRVSGGTRRSRLPISVITPHVYDVTAVTEVSIIVFSQNLVQKINEITRTYTGVNREHCNGVSTAAISNGVQSIYFEYSNVSVPCDEG